MSKSTTLFLIISFILNSCAPNQVLKGYFPTITSPKSYKIPYFSNADLDYVYKTNISFYGKELSGILIAKKINENTHRIVFTTEFGNKLFDFEISEDAFKINSIVSELNRNVLINTLKADFRMLLRKQYAINGAFENAEITVYKSEVGKDIYYIFTSKTQNKLLKIVEASKRKEKINLSFIAENDIFARNIIVQHANINLRIELIFFKS